MLFVVHISEGMAANIAVSELGLGIQKWRTNKLGRDRTRNHFPFVSDTVVQLMGGAQLVEFDAH